MKTSTLSGMFAPRSIAVIGASRRNGTLGKMFLDAVVAMKFTGQIYPVNPKAEEINGIPCYPDIYSIPEIPDLAIILIARDYVLPTLDMLAEKQVHNVIIVSAGFRETGPEGAELERSVVKKLEDYGMRMIGPNSMGLFNAHPKISLNATFSPTQPIPGNVAFISQSGALGVAVLELSQRIGLGFSLFVSTGNKADIGDVDVLNFLHKDENTNTIILYQEALDHPAEFRSILNQIIPHKPVLSLKSGRTQSGERAASSHTGSLASDDRLTDAFLHQCGVIRCDTLQDLLDAAYALSTQPLPQSNHVAVVTNAGGPGILASDALEMHGLSLPLLSEKTQSELAEILPAEAGIKNPVDMIASADHTTYAKVCAILNQDPGVDAVIVIVVKPPIASSALQITSEVSAITKTSRKPFLFVIMADTDQDNTSQSIRKLGMPVYSYPHNAAQALSKMIWYQKIRDKKDTPVPEISSGHKYLTGKTQQLSFDSCAGLLEQYNIPLAPYLLTGDLEKAQLFLKEHHKVVVKIADPEIIHKSDLGLVKLGITEDKQLADAFEQINLNITNASIKADSCHYLVQKMVAQGIELIIGASTDALLGPVIMFGVGGIFVELYQDIVFRVLPISLTDANEMIDDIKGQKLLDGFRGLPKADRKQLARIIFAFGNMIYENPQITEMDINPLIWPEGYDYPVVVDCRATVKG